MPRCCAGFLDPNPRDFSNFKARVRTEEKVKPGSRDSKHVSMSCPGVVGYLCWEGKGLGPRTPIMTQCCRHEQAGDCICWEESLFDFISGKGWRMMKLVP